MHERHEHSVAARCMSQCPAAPPRLTMVALGHGCLPEPTVAWWGAAKPASSPLRMIDAWPA